jgi:uncharacterized protein (TIGR03435 family)
MVSGGPDWMNQTAYAIEAQSQQPATHLQFQAMLRTLLEDRFGLKIHRETSEGDIYALVLDRSDDRLGPKAQPWTGTCANGRTPTEDEYDDPHIPACPSGLFAPRLVMDGGTMFSAATCCRCPCPGSFWAVSCRTAGTDWPIQDRHGLPVRAPTQL